MSLPQHPETLIIKNKYYPEGLKEIDIWYYYQKVKNQLLRETIGKNLIVFFAIDLNKFTVIRKRKDMGLIILTPSNYNTIVSGRTVSFHNSMNRYSDYGVIDIDTDDFEKAKDVALELYDFFMKQRFVKDIKIIFTGKDSFHLRIFFATEFKIEDIKQKLTITLEGETFKNLFTIKGKRTGKIPNLDLQRNVLNGGYIAINSLSVDGLRCIEVSKNRIKNFRKDMAKIK